jgi:hypothetical protein
MMRVLADPDSQHCSIAQYTDRVVLNPRALVFLVFYDADNSSL